MSDLRTRDLKSIIERHAEEILAEVRGRVLAELSASLGGIEPGHPSGAAGIGPRSSPRREPPPGTSRARRTLKELKADSDKLLEAIRSNPGVNAEQLREITGLAHNEIVIPIRALLADGLIRKRGEKRATRYFAS
jgi:hypothetical protein